MKISTQNIFKGQVKQIVTGAIHRKVILAFSFSFILSFAAHANSGADEEINRIKQLIEPIIYSNTYEVKENDTFKYVENKDVRTEFKARIRLVKDEMLEQLIGLFPQLCRENYEDAESGCLSPLRGSEYYYIYDSGKLLGFVFIGFGTEVTNEGIGLKDKFAYRYIVHRSGRLIQNGFFDINNASETK